MAPVAIELASSGSTAPGTSGADRIWLLGASMLSVQVGAGFAARLMEHIGAPAVVMFRQGGAAVVLLVVCRPRLRGRTSVEWRTIVALGVVLAVMNTSFYGAVQRLPLGVAVTIELVGPLGLAAALSRRRADLVWVGVALAGVALLGGGGSRLDPLGIGLALTAAGGWASYILLSRSTGRRSDGVADLGLAMAVAAALVAPVGLAGGVRLLELSILGAGALVAVLAGLVPFSLEMVALRTVPARVFGVLMSLSPVAATATGAVLLGQRLEMRQVFAMGFVMLASVATVRGDRRPSASDPVRRPAPRRRRRCAEGSDRGPPSRSSRPRSG